MRLLLPLLLSITSWSASAEVPFNVDEKTISVKSSEHTGLILDAIENGAAQRLSFERFKEIIESDRMPKKCSQVFAMNEFDAGPVIGHGDDRYRGSIVYSCDQRIVQVYFKPKTLSGTISKIRFSNRLFGEVGPNRFEKQDLEELLTEAGYGAVGDGVWNPPVVKDNAVLAKF